MSRAKFAAVGQGPIPFDDAPDKVFCGITPLPACNSEAVRNEGLETFTDAT